jgi:hypothetical protein
MNPTANRDRLTGRQLVVPIGIKDLFAEAETFVLQQNLGNRGGGLGISKGVVPVVGISVTVTEGTMPMELDALRLEINVLRESVKGRTDNLFNSRLPSVSHDGYVDKNRTKNKNKNKHITKLQITNQNQIDRKQIPPSSAVGFTHSGDEAPLVRK